MNSWSDPETQWVLKIWGTQKKLLCERCVMLCGVNLVTQVTTHPLIAATLLLEHHLASHTVPSQLWRRTSVEYTLGPQEVLPIILLPPPARKACLTLELASGRPVQPALRCINLYLAA